MSKPKALVVDFDGTIASDGKGEITHIVQEAVKRIIEKDYIFSIVTGRPYFGRISEVCKKLNLQHPQIAYGGAEIRNPKNDEIFWAKYLQDKKAKAIINYLLKKNIYFTVEKDHYIFTPDGENHFYPSSFTCNRVQDVEITDIPKIVIPANSNKFSLSDIEVILSNLEGTYKNINVVKGKIGKYFGLDITAGQANKYTALLKYMEMLNLQPDEVVAVGDGYNDFPLLMACGTKIAMENSPQELKEIADLIIPTQKENGLLTVIDTFFE